MWTERRDPALVSPKNVLPSMEECPRPENEVSQPARRPFLSCSNRGLYLYALRRARISLQMLILPRPRSSAESVQDRWWA